MHVGVRRLLEMGGKTTSIDRHRRNLLLRRARALVLELRIRGSDTSGGALLLLHLLEVGLDVLRHELVGVKVLVAGDLVELLLDVHGVSGAVRAERDRVNFTVSDNTRTIEAKTHLSSSILCLRSISGS